MYTFNTSMEIGEDITTLYKQSIDKCHECIHLYYYKMK